MTYIEVTPQINTSVCTLDIILLQVIKKSIIYPQDLQQWSVIFFQLITLPYHMKVAIEGFHYHDLTIMVQISKEPRVIIPHSVLVLVFDWDLLQKFANQLWQAFSNKMF